MQELYRSLKLSEKRFKRPARGSLNDLKSFFSERNGIFINMILSIESKSVIKWFVKWLFVLAKFKLWTKPEEKKKKFTARWFTNWCNFHNANLNFAPRKSKSKLTVRTQQKVLQLILKVLAPLALHSEVLIQWEASMIQREQNWILASELKRVWHHLRWMSIVTLVSFPLGTALLDARQMIFCPDSMLEAEM